MQKENFTEKNQKTFDSAVKSVDASLQELEESLPKDEITELSEAKIGTSEYSAFSRLLDSVAHINSTHKVNFTILGFKFLGILAIIISVSIKIWSIQFDHIIPFPNNSSRYR